jgi:hypothetical protein
MRNQTESVQNSTSGVVSFASWRIDKIEALPSYRLRVKFIDGTEGEVDLSRLVMSGNAGVFAALRDPVIFEQAYVECGVVTWPGGIDLAPDAMYDEIKKQGFWILE